ncbi:MAG: hypothetical protein ACRDH5_06395, partial [bacterium]
PTAPRPSVAMARTSRAQVLRRRRRVFGGLCLVAALTLVPAVAFPGLRLVLGVAHLLVDAALTAYVVGLRRLHLLARERAAKVRYLPVAVAIPVETPDADTAVASPAVRSAAL